LGVDFAGSISGSGGLIQQGSGTLILTGGNTYGGGTTIAGGTLQIGAGATGSLVGNVTNRGTIIFKRSDDYAFSEAISGSGGVVHAGNILRFSAAPGRRTRFPETSAAPTPALASPRTAPARRSFPARTATPRRPP
jgi:autotransporter-associated beta strand protein